MSDVEIIASNLIEVTVEPPSVVEIEVAPNPIVEVEVFPGGVVIQGGTNLSLQYQMITSRLVNQPQLYREFGYLNGNLVSIDAWSATDKLTKIFEIRFTYTGDFLTQKTLTDVESSTVLTVIYGYTGSDLTSISETFS